MVDGTQMSDNRKKIIRNKLDPLETGPKTGGPVYTKKNKKKSDRRQQITIFK